MMSLTYCKLELLICLHFPLVATRRACIPWWQPGGHACYFDVASGPFKCHFGSFMAVRYSEEILLDLKGKDRKSSGGSGVLIGCE